MTTCRFCKEVDFMGSMVKHGTRHYAHHRCYLDAGKPLRTLSTFAIESFPVRLLAERELLDEARSVLKERDDAIRARGLVVPA